jgi:hypothetical protein
MIAEFLEVLVKIKDNGLSKSTPRFFSPSQVHLRKQYLINSKRTLLILWDIFARYLFLSDVSLV